MGGQGRWPKVTIKLFRNHTGWCARFTGSEAAGIRILFGTDVLPLPFTAQAKAEAVCAAIQANHPDAEVVVVENQVGR